MEYNFSIPNTDQVIFLNAKQFDFEKAKKEIKPVLSDSKLKKEIDNLSLNENVKAYLFDISKRVEKIGDWSFKIGHKIVEMAIAFVKRYPNTAAGLLIGALTGFIISSIPVIGWLIGWLVMPLCTALGIGIGAWMDMKDKQLKGRIKEEVMQIFGSFNEIKAAA